MTGRIAKNSPFFAAAIAVCAAGGESAARAEEPWSLGAYVASSCTPCHGSRNHGIPVIAGLAEGQILARLAQYRNGERDHEIMATVARSLSDTEAAAVAKYLSRLPAGKASP